MNEPAHKSATPCRTVFVAFAGVFLFAVLSCGGILLYLRFSFRSFNSYRGLMHLRQGLVVTNESLHYSPGMDGIMWSRFTVQAKKIGDVFDPIFVDAKLLNEPNFSLSAPTWVTDSWWDPGKHRLTGGEVENGDEYLNIGYIDNNDGTLTVYVYWFEV